LNSSPVKWRGCCHRRAGSTRGVRLASRDACVQFLRHAHPC
jgi:hypothetical protein